jgi:hypothetical protein
MMTALDGPIERDDDWICEEVAWDYIMLRGWVPTPQLLFALKEFVVERVANERAIRTSSYLDDRLEKQSD